MIQEAMQALAYGKIEDYYPDSGPLRRELYPKHTAFFAAGAEHFVRMMMAANRVGKTEGVGLYEATLHMTGQYPPWWVGKRFTRPVRVWLAGDTSKTVRETLQVKLLGPWNEFGTGILPKEQLEKWTPKQGVPETVDTFTVRHVSGGLSRGVFKSYDQKRQAFQGSEQELILLDEEPPEDIYGECVIRTMTTGGLILLTFTPLSGVTKLIKHLRSSHTWEIGATWDDVPHLSAEEKKRLWDATPAYMRDARAKGIPSRGSGVVYTVSRHTVECEPFIIPPLFARIGGLDFGWDHPSAAVELCHDRESDVLYVTKEHQQRQASPLVFSAGIKPWGKWLPWAWPHDGLREDKDPQGGRQVAQMYRDQDLNMLPKPASWNDETLDNSVEPGVLGILDYMVSGRFKVFKTLTEWWKQFDDYHRKDGIIVKEDDDLMDATRIAFMCRRFAAVKPSEQKRAERRPNWRTT
jgi:phage terminase large subunit-like protein